jgi:hypothetical protein
MAQSRSPKKRTPSAASPARRKAPGKTDKAVPTGEPGRDRLIDRTAPPHPGDLPGELGPPAGESSRVR